jgi:hypothetical protein
VRLLCLLLYMLRRLEDPPEPPLTDLWIPLAGNSSDETTRGLVMEPSHFDLAPNQKEWLAKFQESKKSMGSRGLDSLQRFLTIDPMSTLMPAATSVIEGEHDACRIHGSIPIAKVRAIHLVILAPPLLAVNNANSPMRDHRSSSHRVGCTITLQVAANFHITAGKSIHHARGHAHLAHIVPPNEVNFSHRIDRLSFSDEEIGGHTLDGDCQVADDRFSMYQYFIKVGTPRTPFDFHTPNSLSLVNVPLV